MRSSGSPGSWPPSAAEFRCVPLTLHSHLKTSKSFPEFDCMFMAANRAVLTSHAPARVRIALPRRGLRQCPRPFPPGLLQPPRGPADPRQHPPLPPGRLDLLADRHPPIVPAAFRKLDAIAVLTGPLLPAPRELVGAAGCWIATGSPSTRCPPGEHVVGSQRSEKPISAAWTLTSLQVPFWRPGDAFVSVRR